MVVLRGSTQQLTETDADTHSQALDRGQGSLWKSLLIFKMTEFLFLCLFFKVSFLSKESHVLKVSR